MKGWFARANEALLLAPADEASVKLVSRMEPGEGLELVVRKVRSLKFHRRYWALMTQVSYTVEKIEIGPDAWMPVKTAEDVHLAMKLLTGHYYTHPIEGTDFIVRIPKPTNFDEMTAEEWSKFYKQVLDVLYERVFPTVPNIDEELLRLAS